jgi:Transglycosylase SLT domain
MPIHFPYRSGRLQRKRFAPSFPAIPAATARRRISLLTAGWRLCLCGVTTVLLLAAVSIAYAEPIAATPPSVVVTADRIAGFVAEASQRFAFPSSWIRAVMQAESLGNARAVSPKGAMGLMQIMPETWTTLRLHYGLGADPYDPHDNITAGTAYLRGLHDRYGDLGFLAAYNAGPARYEDHLATGRSLPTETISYVAAVASLIGGGTSEGTTVGAVMIPPWTHASLFAPHPQTGSARSRPSSSPQMQQRPADRTAQDWTALAPLSDGLFARISSRSDRP